MVTHCYRHCLGSTFCNSSCGSAEYPGEAIPHHLGVPMVDPGHCWASFFSRKSTFPFMATAFSSTITCNLAMEAKRKQVGSQPGKVNTELSS
ncbi:unnamed protein product [Nyctereutes procyonoides]|uniref:(raccoon dog) hypothetical protein n=1 Tax=Nyctereutes procyonoides TaxID=34880 RepID=A0A811ZP67_NYCPR|nr:unnamed protein product [Nyctereutes procyonoides]